MFNSARFKLTFWYSLIIMIVSISFSLAMYRVMTAEFDRVERAERLRIQRGYPNQVFIITPDVPPRAFFIDPEVIEETKERIRLILVGINIGVFGVSTIGGYFLAGQTLKPIKDMVDRQNRFLTDASHELRTPITSMKSEIEVTLRDKKMTLDDAKSLMFSNLEEVNNLQALSDSLIKLTRYERKDNSFEFKDISLKEVIQNALKNTNGMAKKKGIKIHTNTEEYTLQGDKVTLTEVFTILIDNAIKYSPKHTQITISSQKIDGHINISVNDQGVGISKSDLPHVFDRFYRSDKSRTKSKVSGYGLGLSIAKEIISHHGGQIFVRSEPEKGSTFTIKLPIKH